MCNILGYMEEAKDARNETVIFLFCECLEQYDVTGLEYKKKFEKKIGGQFYSPAITPNVRDSYNLKRPRAKLSGQIRIAKEIANTIKRRKQKNKKTRWQRLRRSKCAN